VLEDKLLGLCVLLSRILKTKQKIHAKVKQKDRDYFLVWLIINGRPQNQVVQMDWKEQRTPFSG